MKISNFKFQIWIPFLALTFAILFNLWLFKPELSIKSDPNDNIFQFGLISRADIIWESYHCPFSLECWTRLFDHWVPEWAEGYPLPFYYSHLPQIAIVTSYHLLVVPVCVLTATECSFFFYYHLLTYLVLSFFPLSLMMAMRTMGFSPLVQVFAALFASHISTDGLYGMDNSSYLWRGYGLSSQLFAWFFMPLAFAYTFRALEARRSKLETRNESRSLRLENSMIQLPASHQFSTFKFPVSSLAILFLFLTLSSHFGLGYITLMSLAPLVFMSFNRREIIVRGKKLVRIVGITVALLSYWLIPFIKEANFNAISVWDPVWKFNSFGYFEVLSKFFKGELIDFGRGLPVLTMLTLVGFFAVLLGGKEGAEGKERLEKKSSLQLQPSIFQLPTSAPLALLFPFWLLLFFGRTTWGPLLKFIPGLEGYHLHRFLNGLHLSVLFLAPIGAAWVVSFANRILLSHLSNLSHLRNIPGKTIQTIVFFSLTLATCYLLLVVLYPQTITYARPNGEWIRTANVRFDAEWKDFDELIATLRKLPPGRIYAGKPGYWGRDFKIGDTQVYMALSSFSFEISNFLPETWSPNSDTEQFFDERVKNFYDLYNLRYVVGPETVQFPEFVKLKKKFGKFLLYEVETSGYFTVGRSNLTVFTNRTNYPNLVHLWQISPLLENHLFPLLTFKKRELQNYPNSIILTDANLYKRTDNDEKSIFAESPLFIPPGYTTPQATFRDDQVFAGQKYSTHVDITADCIDCYVIFKTTYHPNWKMSVDGENVDKVITFPFSIGIPAKPGSHFIVAEYQPSRLKVVLLSLSIIGIIVWIFQKRIKKRLV